MAIVRYLLLVSLASYVSSATKCVYMKKVPGNCVPLKDCVSAIELLKNKKLPQTCGFEKAYPIVCCPVEGTEGITTEGVENHIVMNNRTVSGRKCKEYGSQLKNLYSNRWDTDIIGGMNTYLGEFPNMAALGYGEIPDITWNCGGSLISDRFVLTAAHCVKSSSFGEVKYVQLGDILLDAKSGTHQDYLVMQIIKHPSYAPPSKYHDIALLKLDRVVKFTPFIKPACLFTEPTLNSIKDFTFEVTGWGWTEVGGSGSNILKKVSLELFKDCKPQYDNVAKRLLPEGIVSASQICAGSRSQEKDACSGDSGGPLQVFYSKELLHCVVGITSFGKSCATPKVPGVYTRVSNYIPWIEKIVWPNN